MHVSLDKEVAKQTVEDGIKFVISKTQENCQLARVYKANFDQDKGHYCATYLHNSSSDRIGKIGTVFLLKSCPSVKEELAEIARTLCMHTAAMKPSYHSIDQVPEQAKEKAIEIQQEQTLAKLGENVPEAKKEKAMAGAAKTAVSKLNKAEVLLE